MKLYTGDINILADLPPDWQERIGKAFGVILVYGDREIAEEYELYLNEVEIEKVRGLVQEWRQFAGLEEGDDNMTAANTFRGCIRDIEPLLHTPSITEDLDRKLSLGDWKDAKWEQAGKDSE